MKVNDPNLQGPGGPLSTGGSTGVSKLGQAGRAAASPAPAGDASDGVSLSGLAQALRRLDVDSPERQARVESLAQAYAHGSYQVDAEATAGGIVDDALKHK